MTLKHCTQSRCARNADNALSPCIANACQTFFSEPATALSIFISLNPHIFVGQRKEVREIRTVEIKTRRDEVTAWDPVHRIHTCSTLAHPSQGYLHGCPFPIGVHGIVFTVFRCGAGLVIKSWGGGGVHTCISCRKYINVKYLLTP